MPTPIADGRMINRAIADSDGYASLSPPAAVLFAMMIPWYNAHGKMNGGPGFIKDEICPKVPYLTYENIPSLLSEISKNTNVKWFKSDGRYWIHSLSFNTEHQRLKNQGEDKLPSYSSEDEPLTSEALPKQSGSSSEALQIMTPEKDKDKDKDKKKKKEHYAFEFEKFWQAYPKKSGSKKAAFDIWRKLNGERPDIETILHAITIQTEWRARASPGEFRPEWKDPERWIKNRMWEAEMTETREEDSIEKWLKQSSPTPS